MDPSRIGRVLSDNQFSALNCLRLAKLAGEPPSAVFRSAGKDDKAELIEELYGGETPTLSPTQRRHLDKWDALPRHGREALDVLIDEILWKQQRRQKPRRPTPAQQLPSPLGKEGAMASRPVAFQFRACQRHGCLVARAHNLKALPLDAQKALRPPWKQRRSTQRVRLAVKMLLDLIWEDQMRTKRSVTRTVNKGDVYRHGFLGQPGECIHAAGVSANARRTTAGARKPSRSINHCWF